MKNFYYILAFATFHFSGRVYAQGCSDIEPDDPYCQLPLYGDKEVNATFDDLAPNTVITDYQGAAWEGVVTVTNKSQDQLVPHSIANYVQASTGEAVISATTDYLYLISLDFGCSAGSTNSTNSTQVAEACTLQVEGWCLPIGFPGYAGQLEHLKWTFHYVPHLTAARTANMTYASLYESKTTFDGTSKSDHPVLCTNYTLTAKNRSGAKASLYLDDVDLALYTENNAYY